MDEKLTYDELKLKLEQLEKEASKTNKEIGNLKNR